MNSRWLLVLGLATVMLAVGCNYWNNLVETKTQSHSELTLKIMDAWTKEVLTNTQCRENTRNLILNPDGSGMIHLTDPTIGEYSLDCSGPAYHNTKASFRISPGTTHINIQMARLGGPDWYEFEPNRRVSIQLDSGNFRLPGKPRFVASPSDTTNIFRYQWRSSRYPNLDIPWGNRTDGLNMFQYNLGPITSDSVLDTLTLSVRATLGGQPEYEVGTVQMPIVWTQNIKPKLTIRGTPLTTLQLGCLDDIYKVAFSAHDEDGQCFIEFSSEDSSSALGKKTYPSTCDAGKILIPLANPFKKFAGLGLESGLSDSSYLKIKVWDDNGESSITTLSFETHPHILPIISIQNVDTRSVYFSRGPAIEFNVKASDSTASLAALILNWGDGQIDTLGFRYPDPAAIDNVYKHQYISAGDFKVSATIRDGCGAEATANLLETVHVQSNARPSLSISALGYQLIDTIPAYQIQVSAADRDLASAQDSLLIRVNWGDGKAEPPIRMTTNEIGRLWTLSHVYLKPPLNASEYSLTVDVYDGNGGVSDTLLLVMPYR